MLLFVTLSIHTELFKSYSWSSLKDLAISLQAVGATQNLPLCSVTYLLFYLVFSLICRTETKTPNILRVDTLLLLKSLQRLKALYTVVFVSLYQSSTRIAKYLKTYNNIKINLYNSIARWSQLRVVLGGFLLYIKYSISVLVFLEKQCKKGLINYFSLVGEFFLPILE